jgi:hypothetical protein
MRKFGNAALGSPTNLLEHETHRLEQSKCDMHDLGLALRAQPEPTSLEQLQHLGVFRQDLGDQRLEPGCTGNSSKMTHQCPADASPLILAIVESAIGTDKIGLTPPPA